MCRDDADDLFFKTKQKSILNRSATTKKSCSLTGNDARGSLRCQQPLQLGFKIKTQLRRFLVGEPAGHLGEYSLVVARLGFWPRQAFGGFHAGEKNKQFLPYLVRIRANAAGRTILVEQVQRLIGGEKVGLSHVENSHCKRETV